MNQKHAIYDRNSGNVLVNFVPSLASLVPTNEQKIGTEKRRSNKFHRWFTTTTTMGCDGDENDHNSD